MPEVLRELLPQPPGGPPGEDELKTLFLELWPDQARHLASYRAKPGCSCRGHLQEAMIKEPAKLATLLEALYRLRGKTFLKPETGEIMDASSPRPGSAAQAAVAARPPPLRHLQGQTRDIPDTPEAYAGLLKDLQKQGLRFTGLSVRQLDNGNLRVYFY